MKFIKLTAMVFLAVGLNLKNIANAAESKNPEKNNFHSGFIAKEDHKIIKTIGKYEDRHSPFSTFKVALALMGFDSGILKSKDSPKWPFKEEYEKNFQNWYTRDKGLEYHWLQAHTPETFMKYSVVWFSHLITERLGKDKFQNYVTKLKYGNMDVTGTPGKNDGLLNSWLGTSLLISPLEEVEFLEKLLANKLSVSRDAHEKTREIMDRKEEWQGWKLYGKTGGGTGNNGWFVGWLEKDNQQIVFALYLDRTDPNLNLDKLPNLKSIGMTAKEVCKRELSEFLSQAKDH